MKWIFDEYLMDIHWINGWIEFNNSEFTESQNQLDWKRPLSHQPVT